MGSKLKGYVARNVFEYLQEQKRCRHRGLTMTEIYFKFWGVISERTVREQVSRLKKGKMIREKKVPYGKRVDVIFYEAR